MDDKPELFQVTVTFGMFSTREEAATFRRRLQDDDHGMLAKNRFISGEIRGSFK